VAVGTGAALEIKAAAGCDPTRGPILLRDTAKPNANGRTAWWPGLVVARGWTPPAPSIS